MDIKKKFNLDSLSKFEKNLVINMPSPIYTPNIKTIKKKRTNWKKELKECRAKTLQEVRDALIAHKRDITRDWHIGYMSAVTVVEIMQIKENAKLTITPIHKAQP